MKAGGDEDQRHVTRALAVAHPLGQLEAVHAGHLHVDNRQRHFVGEQQVECVGARPGGQDVDAVAAEQGRERQQVLLVIVDKQAFHLYRRGRRIERHRRLWHGR